LADAGRDVLVIDRRKHPGGNVYDELHPSGILMNRYGPHYFRTNSEKIWNFVNKFAQFYPYEAIVKTIIDGKYENWPVTASCIQRLAGEGWQPDFHGQPTNFEEAVLSKMPRVVYEKFIKNYTQKQWGKTPSQLSAKLATRFQVRQNEDPRLMQHKYQGIPEGGYTHWVQAMLKGIPLELSCDYLKSKDNFSIGKKLIYTGCIDEYFGFKLGRLSYRGQQRETHYYADRDNIQICGQVNNPSLQEGSHIRTIEWKHMMPPLKQRQVIGTLITKEIPFSPADVDQNEYPMADEANNLLYQQYQELAAKDPKLLLCGRLATYQYLDMDQAIAGALVSAKALLEKDDAFDHQTY
jgi:UDP-galactopyranose mutase